MIDWPESVKHAQNKYSLWYTALVTNAALRGWTKKTASGYVEIHHIIPRSLGGTDIKTNLVHLTAREHYIAHALLWKMLFVAPFHKKMVYALNSMANKVSPSKSREYKVNSRIFEKLRVQYAEFMSVDRIGEGNHMYGKKHSAETMRRLAIYHNSPEVIAMKRERATGDNNPAKKPETREKISISQKEKHKRDKANGTGSYSDECRKKHSLNSSRACNERAKMYKIVNKDGLEFVVHGKLSHFCKEHGLSYGLTLHAVKHSISELEFGWRIEELPSKNFGVKIWIHKGDAQRLVLKDKLDDFIKDQWVLGPKPRVTRRTLTIQELADRLKKSMETRERRKAAGYINSAKGKPLSSDILRKRAEARIGKVNPLKGKPLSEEHKKKLKNAVRKPRPPEKRICCEHCSKIASSGNYYRWHSDNCKLNPNKA
jgi:hypothetical protein